MTQKTPNFRQKKDEIGDSQKEEGTLLSFVKELHSLVKKGEGVVSSIGGDIARKRATSGMEALAEAREHFIQALIQDK